MDRLRSKSAKWVLRLTADEEFSVRSIAQSRGLSKNDVVRRAVTLLVRLETETSAGSRFFVVRRGQGQEHQPMEIWML